ncbi:hypothetical protein [Bradyrhizobium sp. SSUT77]|uniref:hypothetical protein n=1 Tax=Bradyrhizobium sp. SSUT77 TaxID=3040603 RepID=UPI002447BE01|nr:hypothetical protein [Bradyrhizobium sp. SSUT77]MDH2347789.1 hypothetical protein [Bradyrhizobium sp. SSUT77]
MLAGENAIHCSEWARDPADCSESPATLAEGRSAGGQAAGQRRRTTGAGEQELPPPNLGHGSANGGDFVDEPLAHIERSFQLSRTRDHGFGLATHHCAGRQRAQTCAASKRNSMRIKMCMRFSGLAEHMSANVVPNAHAMKIGRQCRILLKEIGLAASREDDRNVR